MGKGRTKRSSRNDAVSTPSQGTTNPVPVDITKPRRAADGLNVDDWNEDDIQTYNDLLAKKMRLEEERIELEQKSARHRTERSLLNQDASQLNNLFKPHLEGEQVFIGLGCCLESSPTVENKNLLAGTCHHDICTRAKSIGLSPTEKATVLRYQVRIASEKSQRLQNALRKQRDVELVKLKRDEDNHSAGKAQESTFKGKHPNKGQELDLLPTDEANNSLSTIRALVNGLPIRKENEGIVASEIRNTGTTMHRLRSSSDTKYTQTKASTIKIDDTNRMHEQTDKVMAEALWSAPTSKDSCARPDVSRYASRHVYPRNLSDIPSGTTATLNGHPFSQAMNVVKGMFNMSDPEAVRTAIASIRGALDLNGPMPYVLQKSFLALDDVLSQSDADGSRVGVTDIDSSTHLLKDIANVLVTSPQTYGDVARLGVPEDDVKLGQAIMRSNAKCARIEAAAENDMKAELKRLQNSDINTWFVTLRRLKDQAIQASPVPPLSDIILEYNMNNLIYGMAARRIIQQSNGVASERDLSGIITSTIISVAEKQPERYMEAFNKLNHAIDLNPEHDNVVLLNAMTQVQMSMQIFEAKYRSGVMADKQQSARSDARTNNLLTEMLAVQTEIEKLQSAVDTVKSVKRSDVADSASLFPDKDPESGFIGARKAQSATFENSDTTNLGDDNKLESLLRGMNSEDLFDILCGLNSPTENKTMAHGKKQFKKELKKFLATPVGQEDPDFLVQLREQVEQLAVNVDSRAHPSHSNAQGREIISKFHEALGLNTPSPSPISRSSRLGLPKLRNVPVNTPQVISKAVTTDSDLQDPAFLRGVAQASDELEQMIKSANSTKREVEYLQSSLIDTISKDNQSSAVRRGNTGSKGSSLGNTLDLVEPSDKTISASAHAQPDAAQIQSMSSQAPIDNEEIEDMPSDAIPTLLGKGKKKKNKKRKKNKGKQAVAEGEGDADTSTQVANAAGPRATRSAMPMCERERTIQRQLRAMADSLDELVEMPAGIDLKVRRTLGGIGNQLEDQLYGHVQTAHLIAEVNGWDGLRAWLKEEFNYPAHD